MIESNRRRILAGTCAALASALLLLGLVSNIVAAAETTHGAIALSGYLAVLHVGLTIGAVIGITQLVRHRADRLGLAGAALTFLGATVGARIGAFIQLAAAGYLTGGSPRGAMRALAQNAPAVWASIVPIGLLYPFGLITLGVALFAARYRTAGVLLAAGGALFPLGRAVGIVPAVYASDALLAVAYAFVAKEIFTAWEVGATAPSYATAR